MKATAVTTLQKTSVMATWKTLYMSTKPQEEKFFLTGDEMFLEAVLDGDGNLAPNSKDGWNIYHKVAMEQKSETHPETHLRTDLDIKIDHIFFYKSALLNQEDTSKKLCLCSKLIAGRCCPPVTTLDTTPFPTIRVA
jgi:hypothetical protein